MVIEVPNIAQLLYTLDRIRKVEGVLEVSRTTSSSAEGHPHQ